MYCIFCNGKPTEKSNAIPFDGHRDPYGTEAQSLCYVPPEMVITGIDYTNQCVWVEESDHNVIDQPKVSGAIEWRSAGRGSMCTMSSPQMTTQEGKMNNRWKSEVGYPILMNLNGDKVVYDKDGQRPPNQKEMEVFELMSQPDVDSEKLHDAYIALIEQPATDAAENQNPPQSPPGTLSGPKASG